MSLSSSNLPRRGPAGACFARIVLVLLSLAMAPAGVALVERLQPLPSPGAAAGAAWLGR